jgi:hypothetical protein
MCQRIWEAFNTYGPDIDRPVWRDHALEDEDESKQWRTYASITAKDETWMREIVNIPVDSHDRTVVVFCIHDVGWLHSVMEKLSVLYLSEELGTKLHLLAADVFALLFLAVRPGASLGRPPLERLEPEAIVEDRQEVPVGARGAITIGEQALGALFWNRKLDDCQYVGLEGIDWIQGKEVRDKMCRHLTSQIQHMTTAQRLLATLIILQELGPGKAQLKPRWQELVESAWPKKQKRPEWLSPFDRLVRASESKITGSDYNQALEWFRGAWNLIKALPGAPPEEEEAASAPDGRTPRRPTALKQALQGLKGAELSFFRPFLAALTVSPLAQTRGKPKSSARQARPPSRRRPPPAEPFRPRRRRRLELHERRCPQVRHLRRSLRHRKRERPAPSPPSSRLRLPLLKQRYSAER